MKTEKELVLTIDIAEELVNYIQSIDVDRMAHQEVIKVMLDQNMDTSTDAFKFYSKEYARLNFSFGVAKDEITNTVLPEEYRTENYEWKLDYSKKQVSVYKI